MALTPQVIADTRFRTVKRNGYDPGEVDAFRADAASALEAALQQATAMEARARAAAAKVQELQATAPRSGEAAADAGPTAPPVAAVSEAETISRTLLLAQRTADTTLAEAERQAEVARQEARAEADAIVEAARAESRAAGEEERVRVEGEVQALLARRDFLQSDVVHLEQHIEAQRERITEVVAQLEAMTNRVPNGLAAMRAPQLSASDQPSDDLGPGTRPSDEHASEAAADDDDVDVATLIDEVAASDDAPS
jgi:DivIVA domain-containing protein